MSDFKARVGPASLGVVLLFCTSAVPSSKGGNCPENKGQNQASLHVRLYAVLKPGNFGVLWGAIIVQEVLKVV